MWRMPRLLAPSLLISLALTLPAAGQTPDPTFRPYRTDTPPVIDGVLDDPVWQQAPRETGFKTWLPDFGADMSEQTVVYYAFDQENLYFGFRCFDSDPGRIKSSVSARDRIRADDWICVNLDSFNDHQSLYALYVNPAGIQSDSRATVVNEDPSVDVVWYSAGTIDAEGWSAEIRIPFKSIRFSYQEPVEMGVIFERHISRRSEFGTYPALDPAMGANIPAFLTQTRTLVYSDVRHYRLFEVIPATTWAQNRALDRGRLASDAAFSTMSLTTKYGITSRLTLDATVNPDFSQVEADAGQVDFNQRFALFYPEKRPFFLEGRENFIFGGSGGSPLGAVVHTRTIVDPSAGLKVAGKIGERNTIASIYAVDALAPGAGEGERAHVGIFRYKRALSQDSFLGGFYTGRETFNNVNRLVGADGQIRLAPSSLLGFHGFASQTETKGATSDTDRGHALGIDYTYNTRDWILNGQLLDLSEDFDTQVGYVTRTAMSRIQLGALRFLYPESSLIQRIEPMVHVVHNRDHPSDLWESSYMFDLRFRMPRSSTVQLGISASNEIFLGERLQSGNLRFRGSSQILKQLLFTTYIRYGKKLRYVADPYQATGTDATASLVFQPTEHINSMLSFTYSDLIRYEDDTREYNYTILRSRNTYQVNRYLFFRGIIEHNSFRDELKTDLLASFTYIPDTVIHIGYGSLYEKMLWDGAQYLEADDFLESRRGLFFKASYLWRF